MLYLNTDIITHFAVTIRNLKIPIDDFTDPKYFPPRNTDAETIARYFFFMVAIDHRTGTLDKNFEGYVGGDFVHGADALYRLGMLIFEKDPDFFSPKRMSRIARSDIEKWLVITEPEKIAIRDPEIRAFLLRDCGEKILKMYDGSVLGLIEASDHYLYSVVEGGFIDRLRIFRAYEDPVEKKSFLLAKFLERRGLLRVKDPENAQVPVDNHLVRIAIRSGLVIPSDDLRKYFVSWKQETSREEDVLIRLVIRMAYKKVTELANISPFILDDLLWLLGRKICVRGTPKCDWGTIDELNVKGCPLRTFCEAYNKKEKLRWNEHRYFNTWYY